MSNKPVGQISASPSAASSNDIVRLFWEQRLDEHGCSGTGTELEDIAILHELVRMADLGDIWASTRLVAMFSYAHVGEEIVVVVDDAGVIQGEFYRQPEPWYTRLGFDSQAAALALELKCLSRCARAGIIGAAVEFAAKASSYMNEYFVFAEEPDLSAQTREDALTFLKTAADSGSAHAAFHMAKTLARGDLVPADMTTARFYAKLAEERDPQLFANSLGRLDIAK